MAGITPTGFDKKTLAEILTEIEAAELAEISASLNLKAPSVFASLNGIFAERLSELWDLLQGVYNAQYPDSASDANLDNVASITNSTRLAATKSTVTITCGTVGGVPVLLPIGRVVSVAGTGARFVSTVADTIPAFGTVDIPFEAEDFGPIAAPSGTATVIETPVAGWDSASNALDADQGRNQETDSEFRARRIALLSAPAASTVESIRAAILNVTGVTQAFVFENTSLLTDAAGLPGKSFEAVIEGGLDADLAAVIFNKKPIGIEAFGSTIIAVVDSQGFSHDIGFSRPSDVNIWIELTVQANASTFGGGDEAAGIANVKTAITDRGDLSLIGDDVIALVYQCVPLEVTGVIDVTAFTIGTAAAPTTDDNIVIEARELAKFDSARITVTVTY